MGELKGQLLALLTVLVIFGAVAGAMYTAFSATKDKINDNNNSVITNITKGNSQKLLAFKD